MLIHEGVEDIECWHKEKPYNEGTALTGLWGARAERGKQPTQLIESASSRQSWGLPINHSGTNRI